MIVIPKTFIRVWKGSPLSEDRTPSRRLGSVRDGSDILSRSSPRTRKIQQTARPAVRRETPTSTSFRLVMHLKKKLTQTKKVPT